MKRNSWFRAYSEALDDPKVQRLHPALFKAWFNLLCLASQHEGYLPSKDDIAFRLRISAQDASQHVDELILAELIDVMPDGRLTPHNWDGRQQPSDSSAERTRKYRKNKAKSHGDGDGDVTVTVQTRPDQRREDNNKPSTVDRARSGSEEFSVSLGQGRGGSVSVDARRAVCASLAIGNADPLVAAYEAWPPSGKARDPDALFKKTAEGFYRDAPPDVRKACQPLDAEPPPAPLPPVQASPSIRNSKLVRGFRHA